jgi:nucleotide-binding universal stress UspA family protein
MYERILVPVDGSPTSERGLQEAIRLAKLTGAQIRLLHVVDIVSVYAITGEGFAVPVFADILEPVRQGGREILRAARETVTSQGIAADTAMRENSAGRVADLIVDEATDWRADLIVLGTHGRRGVQRMALGSDAELVVRRASVPVLLVRLPA